MKTEICIIQTTFEDGRKGQRIEIGGNIVLPISHTQFTEISATLNLKEPTEVFETGKSPKEELWY